MASAAPWVAVCSRARAVARLADAVTACGEFDPYNATKSLGMKVVTTLARQLGGHLAATSNPGGRSGSCFAVTFPG